MSSKAQPVRATIRVISWRIGAAQTRSRAQSVRPEFGQRGFIGASGQKIKGNTT